MVLQLMARANPKSHSFTVPLLPMRMFCGFMSLRYAVGIVVVIVVVIVVIVVVTVIVRGTEASCPCAVGHTQWVMP